MRSVRGIGQWTDSDGGVRNACVEIAVDDGTARVTVAALDADLGAELPTADRRVAYFLGRVEATIRAAAYASRPIMPDPKPKDRAPARSRSRTRPTPRQASAVGSELGGRRLPESVGDPVLDE